MRPAELTIRPARVVDAPVLAQAERAIAATPGFLVSHPAQLTDERFAQEIAALRAADNGRYLVAETAGQLVGHAMLDPQALQTRRTAAPALSMTTSTPSCLAR